MLDSTKAIRWTTAIVQMSSDNRVGGCEESGNRCGRSFFKGAEPSLDIRTRQQNCRCNCMAIVCNAVVKEQLSPFPSTAEDVTRTECGESSRGQGRLLSLSISHISSLFWALFNQSQRVSLCYMCCESSRIRWKGNCLTT